MAQKKQFSERVQLLAFILQTGANWQPELLEFLEKHWGKIRYLGQLFPFDKTDYYTPEMGEGLFRGVLSFECLVAPEEIIQEKARSNEAELEFAGQSNRSVNIDIGYMDLDKVVLPSYKRGPFKIYGGEGVWLDMLLTYAKGHFYPTAWAFEDFKRNPYEHDLILIRERWRKSEKLRHKEIL